MPAKRLLSDVVSLTPSNYEDFTRCPRLFYCSALLGLPMLEGSVTVWFVSFLVAAGGSYAIALAVRRLLGARSRYVIGS